MHRPPQPRTRKLTIIAQDPGVRITNGAKQNILRAAVDVPAEELAPGPWGYRVQVIDYDASSDTLWKPFDYSKQKVDGEGYDPYVDVSDARLLSDPQFHQQNVYAIVMRILARFEFALGRRVSWSFGGHQLKVAPHAFADANAFYSKDDECLLFGYFADPKHLEGGKRARPGEGIVFTCLSHDVVAHETTHALVDGLRRRYTDPSSADQAAFHEGLADVIALLSVFALKEVMAALLKDVQSYGVESLRNTALFKMAEEMGTVVSQVRGSTLRHSVALEPNSKWIADPEFAEPHRRGEILVAAMLNSLVHIWAARIEGLRRDEDGRIDVQRVVEEGQRAADYLLTMAIRAIDYCPPVHLEFGDYLSAMLTADREIRPDDSLYQFRPHLLASFAAFGIPPASKAGADEPGIWCAPEREAKGTISYDRIHFEPMQRDRDEVFRFVWENRRALGLREDAYSEVQSVRPCVRVGEDGFVLRETVAEYVQILRLTADELAEESGVRLPPAAQLPRTQEIFLHGGGTVIFDEYGRLKYHIHNHLNGEDGRIAARQIKRVRYLAESGHFLQRPPRPAVATASRRQPFAQMHFNRSMNREVFPTESWHDASGAPPADAALD
jgi:hypothetical protein